MTNVSRRAMLGAGAALVATHPFAAMAQKWPDGDIISILLGYGPGGNIDLLVRVLATRLEAKLGARVVIKNRPGASGSLALAELARSKPNGFTLAAVNPSTLCVVPRMLNVGYTKDDFDYVAGWVTQRFGIAVRADSPYQTILDVVEAGKGSTGLFFGTAAALHSLMLYEFAIKSGTKIELVNYKSGPEIMAAILGGQIQGVILNPSDILQHVSTGKLRFLASGGPSRWPEFPQVPTLTEAGYEVRSAQTVGGIAAPKGTPPETLKRLESEIAAILKEPEFNVAIAKLGAETTFLSGAKYKAYIDKNDAFFGELVNSAGLGK
jgi:tripartite-type tricarboxylate transporter receptor subunit TctC